MTVDMDVHYYLVFRVTTCAVRCAQNKIFSVYFYRINFALCSQYLFQKQHTSITTCLLHN